MAGLVVAHCSCCHRSVPTDAHPTRLPVQPPLSTHSLRSCRGARATPSTPCTAAATTAARPMQTHSSGMRMRMAAVGGLCWRELRWGRLWPGTGSLQPATAAMRVCFHWKTPGSTCSGPVPPSPPSLCRPLPLCATPSLCSRDPGAERHPAWGRDHPVIHWSAPPACLPALPARPPACSK